MKKATRCLTLHQPWGTAVVSGPKRIENRSWKPPNNLLGETFLIHAGKTYDKAGAVTIRELWPEMPEDVPHGCIIGAARLIGVIATETADPIGLFDSIDDGRGFGSVCEAQDDPWFFGPFGWVLDEVVAFPRPAELACRGYQTLWEPPISLRPEIDAQLREVKHVTT